MSRDLIRGLAVCAAIVLGGTSAAFAGEVTGKGEPIEVNGKSICAFSGLEDGPFEPGTVQSFGKHPNDAFGNGGVSDDEDNIPNNQGPAAPGVACNPSEPS